MAHGSLRERVGGRRAMKSRSHKRVANPMEWLPRSLGDAATSKRHRREQAFTIMELMVAMALFAIVAAVALPQFDNHPYALWSAQQQLLGDLRLTRSDALTKGDHFRFDVKDATSYEERRMQLVGTQWLPRDPAVRTGTLPSGVTFTTGVGSHFEFNTRGLMLNPGAATTLTLVDSHTSHTRVVTVWPSGQVTPL